MQWFDVFAANSCELSVVGLQESLEKSRLFSFLHQRLKRTLLFALGGHQAPRDSQLLDRVVTYPGNSEIVIEQAGVAGSTQRSPQRQLLLVRGMVSVE